MEPLGLLQDVLAPLQRIRDVIQGATDLKTNLRRRYGDYSSILEPLRSNPEAVAENEVERELGRLTELFTSIADLIGEYTAAPADGKATKFTIKTRRAADFEAVSQELDNIDREVMRQLAIMSLKGAISSSELEVLRGVDQKVEHLTSLIVEMRPPSSPYTAAVPAGAIPEPRNYVKRDVVLEAVDGLINSVEGLTPYAIVGMGGAGKTILASAVVRDLSVREHFCGGMFWVRAGRGAKDGLLPLLQGMAREMGAASTDAPRGVPHAFDSLEQVTQHLTAVSSMGTSSRLVVLDDVWEREVVDALLPLGLKVLVTTRDRSVVGVSGGCLQLGDMSEDEAQELLLKTSSTLGQPGTDARTQMSKVGALCGSLPLALAIASSMSVVKGKGLTAAAWEELAMLFENNAAKKGRVKGQQSTSLHVVLGASLDGLSERKQEEMLKMAVLAPGAVAPLEMLLNLWEIQDAEGTREEAEGLVNKCVLQDMGGSRYRVRDLLLEFVKIKIRAEGEMVKSATDDRQAQYLRRVDVVDGHFSSEYGEGFQGFYAIATLWRSVEKLSGDVDLEAASYRASLGELESSVPNVDAARSYFRVGRLFELQGKFAEAEPLFKRSQAIREQVLGPKHPHVAESLKSRAGLLRAQGKYAEAEPLYERSHAILEKVLGPEHPHVAGSLKNRAGLLRQQGRYAEADPLYLRANEIQEKTLGPGHPNVAKRLNSRAKLLQSQGRYAEADSLYLRAIEIGEETLGPDHPRMA